MEERLDSEQNGNFGAQLTKMLPLIMREFTRRQKNIFTRGALGMPQIVILELLVEQGPCKMSDLAGVLNFTMSAVTAIVDKMVKAHLVKRERSIEDRRVVRVLLLNKGKQVARRIREGRRDLANSLFAVLTPEEKAEYVRILTKVYQNLRASQAKK